MGTLSRRLERPLLTIYLTLLISSFLVGCTSTGQVMSAENMRAALDECLELKLQILVYQRPDRSVMDVRCIPNPEQITEFVTLRPKLPMKLLRPFYDNGQPIPKGFYEQQ